jgi:hypothetical protein
MKKLTLTLFLALAGLVSFGQSTVQTIRLADADEATLSVNIPVGTMVVDVTTKNIYLAIAAVDEGTSITDGLTNTVLGVLTPLFSLINGYVYSVIEEKEVGLNATEYDFVTTKTADGAAVDIAKTDFKVYVNGALLPTDSYTYETGLGDPGPSTGIQITSQFYKYDQISVVYNSIKVRE